MSGKALTVFCRKNTCILIFHRTSKHEPLDPGTFISYSATAIIVISGPLSFIFNFFFYIKEHHSRIFRGSPAVCFISVWNDCAFSFIPFIIHVKLYKILTFFRACVSFLNLIFSPFWATRTSSYKGGRFYGAIVCLAGPPFPGVIFHVLWLQCYTFSLPLPPPLVSTISSYVWRWLILRIHKLYDI